MGKTERLSRLSSVGSALAVAGVSVVLSACGFHADLTQDPNPFSVPFKTPLSKTSTKEGSFSFEWESFDTSRNKYAAPFPEKMYVLSVFRGDRCAGVPITKVELSETTYDYQDFAVQGEQISLGLQLQDGRGMLGPMLCSPVVEYDIVPPIVTEESNAFTVDSLFEVRGDCETGLSVVVSGPGLEFPVTTECVSGQYAAEVTFVAGVGAKDLQVKQTDHAGNESTVSFTKTVVTAPSGLTYPNSAYYFPQNTAIAAQLPTVTGDVIAYSGTLPVGLQLDATTGEITGTPTELGTTQVIVTAEGPAGQTVDAVLSIEIYYGPTTMPDSLTAYPQIDREIPIADILANDFDLSGLEVSFVELGAITGGTAQVVGDHIVYNSILNPGDTGTIVYVAKNSLNQTKEGTISLEILPIPPPDANDDIFSVIQAGELEISKASLLANDTTTPGTEPLNVTGISNVVGGTASFDAVTGKVTFTSTGFTGDPAGFDYTIEHAFGGTDTAHVDITVLQLPGISALVFGAGETAALNAKLAGYTPPTMEDIFNGWGRFAGADWYPSGTPPAGEAASWELLTNPYRVSCTVNSASYTGFVSEEALDYYTHEIVLGSSAADDDAISVIMAFVRDGGVNHTLSAFRTQGGYALASGWGVAYYQDSTLVATIASGNAGPVFKNPDADGWSNRMSRIRIERTGDTFKATASDFGLDAGNLPLNPTSTLTVDLNSNPLLEIFKGPKPYGYGSFSQANSYFDQAQIVGGLDPQYIYDLVNDRVYAYDNSLGYVVVPGVDPYDHLGYPREVTNPETGKVYLLNRDKTYTLLP